MNLKGGIYSMQSGKCVKYGAIVAYLMYKQSKDISEAISRILIKPYMLEGCTTLEEFLRNVDKGVLYPSKKMYGATDTFKNQHNFHETVKSFLFNKYNTKRFVSINKR